MSDVATLGPRPATGENARAVTRQWQIPEHPWASPRSAPPEKPGATRARWRRLAKRTLREPLTHFVAAGLLIFATSHVLEARAQRYTIELGPDQLRRIAATYAQQYGAPPSAAELRALTDDFVRQEVLVREGAALGLDREDEIVRRRVAQKMEFLLQDRSVPREPKEADLQAWYAAHRGDYTLPPRRSFDQIYFAIDQRGEAAARTLAERARRSLGTSGTAPAADPFPGPSVIRLLSRSDTERLFGDAGFAAHVFAAPTGAWSGPVRSSFGWHLVRVGEHQPEQAQRFAAVRDRVAADWKRAEAAARSAAAFAELRMRYRLVGANPT